MKYKRILIKLSGEALNGGKEIGINPSILIEYISQVKEIVKAGVETGIVIGGGNFFRGVAGLETGIDRVSGDYMGMLATIMNGKAIESAFQRINQPAQLFTAFRTEPVGKPYSKIDAINALNEKKVAIFAGGTGNPYFTTDTAASLRALEIEADVLLKGTRVDGVYDSDPEKNPEAVKFDDISYLEAINKNLKVMDLTAFTMCMQNKLPIIVFDMNKPGNLKDVVEGKKVGTLVK